MVARVKMNERFEIVVPEELRRALHIEPGDELLVEVRDGEAVLSVSGRDAIELLRGLHAEIWQGTDPDEYLRSERRAWEDS